MKLFTKFSLFKVLTSLYSRRDDAADPLLTLLSERSCLFLAFSSAEVFEIAMKQKK